MIRALHSRMGDVKCRPDPSSVPIWSSTSCAPLRSSTSPSIRGRRFADKSLPVTDEFLSRKVPELLQANGLDQTGDLVAGYLRINRELRAATERRVREICRDTTPRPLWEGEFLRLPNSAPLSGFADRRTYVYGGKAIDQLRRLAENDRTPADVRLAALAAIPRSPVAKRI